MELTDTVNHVTIPVEPVVDLLGTNVPVVNLTNTYMKNNVYLFVQVVIIPTLLLTLPLVLTVVKLVTIPVKLVTTVIITLVILVMLQDISIKMNVKKNVQTEPTIKKNQDNVKIVILLVRPVSMEPIMDVLDVMNKPTSITTPVLTSVQMVSMLIFLPKPVTHVNGLVLNVPNLPPNVLVVKNNSIYTNIPVSIHVQKNSTSIMNPNLVKLVTIPVYIVPKVLPLIMENVLPVLLMMLVTTDPYVT